MVRLLVLVFLLPTLACGACGSDAHGASDSGPLTFRYTPAGCAYEVTAPAMVTAGLGGDVVGADARPRFVHASFAGASDSSFAVNWHTDVPTTVTTLLFGRDMAAVEAASGADGATGVMAQEGHYMGLRSPSGEDLRVHEVHVCGLSAATTYFYKVGGTGAWSQVFDVATGPPVGTAAPFRFGVTGDSRNDTDVWAAVQSALSARGVEFQVFSGDAVATGSQQSDWVAFFGTEFGGVTPAEVMATTPFMPANGNHDGLSVNYVVQFALPQHQSPAERAEGEEWYSFDYGNAHFVVLNDGALNDVVTGSELEWLEADLASVDRTRTPWVFAMHHFPPYSCSTVHGSHMATREAWQPIYDRYEVDVVFNGHDHLYERSKPIRGFDPGTTDGTVAAAGPNGEPVDQSGTVYIVTGGAGAPLYTAGTGCYHTQVAETVNHYNVVDINGLAFRLESYRLDGTLLDRLEIRKTAP